MFFGWWPLILNEKISSGYCPSQRPYITFQKVVNLNKLLGIILLGRQLPPLKSDRPTERDFLAISKGFFYRWNMPNCIGEGGGKLINMQAPNHSDSDYFSYKKYFR